MINTVLNIISEFWAVLCAMAPYLLFGFLAAGILSQLISPPVVERHLGGKGVGPVAKASILGVPLPLCSCGVIPVAASLRRHGASRGATAAFLLSTPQTGVDSILVTFSLLGPVFAVFRPLAALVTGLVGGIAVSLFAGERSEGGASPRPREESSPSSAGSRTLWRALAYGFVTLPRDIGRALLVGLFLAGVISALVPPHYFAGLLGSGIGPMFVMMVVGIPVYVCATASVPVAATLIAKGISPGAALVFLITGPATNAATIATVYKVLGKRTAAIYLAVVGVCALASGVLLNAFFAATGSSAVVPLGPMRQGLFHAASAIVLLLVLAAAVVPRRRKEIHMAKPQDGANRIDLAIGGMTCSHCAQNVRRALLECQGVESADVDLDAGRAVVTGKAFDVQSLSQAVEALGYHVNDE